MDTFEFFFEGGKLHGMKIDGGSEVLLVFHGFGQSSEHIFSQISVLKKNYTIYIFDLFFHGGSTWLWGDKPLTSFHWSWIIKTFCHDYGIKNFSVFGFSLGARLALATFDAMPNAVKQLILVAPDGIHETFFFKLITKTKMRWLFKCFISRPALFRVLLKLGKRMRFFHSKGIQFIQRKTNTYEKRYQVYYTWMVYRRLIFEHNYLIKNLNKANIDISFFIAQHDYFISNEHVHSFAKKIKNRHITVLKTDHFKAFDSAVLLLNS